MQYDDTDQYLCPAKAGGTISGFSAGSSLKCSMAE